MSITILITNKISPDFAPATLIQLTRCLLDIRILTPCQNTQTNPVAKVLNKDSSNYA